MLYRVVLVILFLIAVLLTLNERMQERRSQEIATGTGPPAIGSGDAYPVSNPNAPTATPYLDVMPTPYPAPPR